MKFWPSSVEEKKYVSTEVISERDVPIEGLSKAITAHYKNPEYPSSLEKIHVLSYSDGEIHTLMHKPREMKGYDAKRLDVDFVDVLNDAYAGHTLIAYDPDKNPHFPTVVYTFTSEGEGRGLATRRLLAANKFCIDTLGEPLNSGRGYDDMTVKRIWQRFVKEGLAEHVPENLMHEFRFKKTK